MWTGGESRWWPPSCPSCRSVVCPWRPLSTCRHSNYPSGSHNWCPCCLCRLRHRQYHCSRRARRSTRWCSGPGQMHWSCGVAWKPQKRHSQSRGEMEGVGLVSREPKVAPGENRLVEALPKLRAPVGIGTSFPMLYPRAHNGPMSWTWSNQSW